MARDLDPGSSPAAFLGAELRRVLFRAWQPPATTWMPWSAPGSNARPSWTAPTRPS